VEVEVRVSLIDLKRAFRRLLARLPDESEAGRDLIVFSARENRLDIVVGGTSEVLNASVVHPGQATVPCPVFRGIARILRFYRRRTVHFAVSAGVLRIDRTDFRHPGISVSIGWGTRGAIVTAKATKAQNRSEP
jgi:hypothetical protein